MSNVLPDPAPTPSYPPSPPYQGVPPAFVAGRRPGLVTAIGVASIVVAGLSLAAGAVFGLALHTLTRYGQIVATMATAGVGSTLGGQPRLVLPTPDEVAVDVRAARQARADRRAGLLDLLAGVRPMSPAVRRQLDGMLARHAERVLPARLLSADELSTADLREVIERVGSPPGAGPADADAASFAFRGTGRLDVYKDRATFVPAGGGGDDRLRTAGPATAEEEDAAAAAAGSVAGAAAYLPPPATSPSADGGDGSVTGPGLTAVRPTPVPPIPVATVASAGPTTAPAPGQPYPSGLTAAEVTTVVGRAQAAAGGKLNPAQVAAVTTALQTSNPPLVTSQQVWSPVRSAQTFPDGSAQIIFATGLVMVDAAGVATQTSGWGGGGGLPPGAVPVPPTALAMLVGEGVASLALAVLLLVAGIQVLRGSAGAVGLHWVYVAVKLPVVAAFGAAVAWVVTDMAGGAGRSTGGADTLVRVGTTMAVAAAVYPVVLACVLASRPVRAFTAGRRQGW